jgi:hypothetical protein
MRSISMNVELPDLEPHLVREVRSMVFEGIRPSQIFEFLKARVDNERTFVAYLKSACPDDGCDEGMIWLVASRWWTGNQTPLGVDRLLEPVFSAARERWQDNKGT